MATFNGQRFLIEQVRSIIDQLEDEDRLIVSDDGSSDRTVEILSEFGPKIQVIGTTKTDGIVSNFERALSAAFKMDFDVYTLADQDDVWLDGRVAEIKHRLSECSAIMMNGIVVDSSAEPTGESIFDFVGRRKGFFSNFLKNSYVGCCLAFRREVIALALPFPKNLPWHDWFLALICESHFDIVRVEQKLMLYRRHSSNASATGLRSKSSTFSKLRSRASIVKALALVAKRRFLGRPGN